METSSRGIGCKTLFIVIALALMAGVFGGGAAGGALGYYAARQVSPAAPIVQALPAGPASSAPETPQVVSLKQDSAIIETVKKLKPAVVTIRNTTRTRTGSGQATGTGVIVDAKGYIVTNNHVVQGAQKLEVLFENGERIEAKLIGADSFSDLAIVQVTGKTMPAIAKLGDSSALQVGEPVIAIGSALGNFRNTVTVGVVSGLNRQLRSSDAAAGEGLIQTDAAINHGNSGGPLLNIEGQIVGINTLVVRGDGDAEGLGFAIPVNTVKQVMTQLIDRGKVARPFMGISYEMLSAQSSTEKNLSLKEGALIQEVTPNSPAAQAGLRVGDVLTQINDANLNEATPLPTLMLKYKPGDTVRLTVIREGKTLNISLTLAERPAAS